MIKIIIIFITLFSLDNLLILFLPIQPIVGNYIVVPNVLLSALCIFCFFDKKNIAPIIAGVFGAFHDLYGNNLFGLYTTLFLLTTVVIKKYVVPSTPINFFSVFYITTTSIIVQEWTTYFLVTTITNRNMTFIDFLQYRLFISIIFNLLTLLISYPFLKKSFEKYHKKNEKSYN